MSSDSSLTPDFQPDINAISNSNSEDEAIFNAIREVGDLERFQQWPDARGKSGYSTMQKCTEAIRQLAYGTASDAMEEYLRMSETTAPEALHTFYECIPQLYHKKYLRKPTQSDVQKIYKVHQQRHGFPGMLGSLDCMHWEWEACPVAWQGQYHRGGGDHDGLIVILEAAASFDLWIWHAFFGMPGANNDVAVINASTFFDRLTDGASPTPHFPRTMSTTNTDII
ncbi:uncharacterized protein LOC143621963 [Bidens hawaiensis]|uniref:uncharacterized protein LOC143621963 n=1 Tax=Bidens hawaiensis TaxID=980011 RepID=UPI0040499ED0